MYKKGKVHPSPPFAVDHLSLLPETILALATTLTAEDKQTLAYLLSCCGGGSGSGSGNRNHDSNRRRAQKKNTGVFHNENGGDGAEHDPVFECNCFNCYLSYWARWDISPNRQVIHEIIEAYEEWLLKKKKRNSKKKKEKAKRELKGNPERNFEEETEVKKDFEIGGFELVESNSNSVIEDVDLEWEKSIARKISSFVGDKIWGFWG